MGVQQFDGAIYLVPQVIQKEVIDKGMASVESRFLTLFLDHQVSAPAQLDDFVTDAEFSFASILFPSLNFLAEANFETSEGKALWIRVSLHVLKLMERLDLLALQVKYDRVICT